jgi:hypothetical protein
MTEQAVRTIDGRRLKTLVSAGLAWLRLNQQLVNSLNVFPVPDGDTGTNMVLTMQAAYNEIAQSDESNFGRVSHSVAHGALMGARGNSGVILSQLWRGFARGADDQELLDAPTLVRAFAMGRDTAYKGVVRPVEGTILTVAKDVAMAAEEAAEHTQDIVTILEQVVVAADLSVQRTPDLLPVLRNAGVVDSGGKGLYFILEGMLRELRGQPIEMAEIVVAPLEAMKLEETLEEIEPGQDFEVVIDFHPFKELDLPVFYQTLEDMGTSIQVGEGDGMYRLHIHVPTEKRYFPIDYTMTLGTITKVAMENLIAQMEGIERGCSHGPVEPAPLEPGHIGVVAVSPGHGIARVFASLGAAAIVEGGQTMNPSTEEILHAFADLPTQQVIILPNNKNIILAAQSAASLSSKQVCVIPSRSVPQGLAAMLRLQSDGDFAKVTTEMQEALDEVQTGEITFATRDVEIDGVQVAQGQFIALLNGTLVVSTPELQATCLGLLEKASAEQYELITLFYGANLNKKEVSQISDAICSAYPGLEIEIQEGCQPHYYFILSLE